ncbi:MAG: acid stress-induced BolA-like protein IbaG/YrbA [Candidatus Omnitrophota bacterium]|jgi:acid stress-induced BolA-like protein IbaG/YrbA
MNPDQIIQWVKDKLPESEVVVNDMTGGGDHWEIKVVSGQFEGKKLLERHRIMHAIMSEPMASGAVHAVKFKTLTPQEL